MKSMIRLTDKEREALDELKQWILLSWPSAQLRLFGSKVNGTSDEESDVDVLVILPFPVDEVTRRSIIHQVFRGNIARDVNISALVVSHNEWDESPLSAHPIRAAIENEGVKL